MSRNFKKNFVAIAVAAAAISLAQAAMANIFIDLQVDPASPGYSAGTPRSITFGASGQSTPYLLDVYALITPNGTNTATAANEGLSFVASSFFVANSNLKGDVSFGSWNTGAPTGINTLSSQTGGQFTTTFGGLGLGGTATTDNTQSHWYIPTTNSLNQTGGVLLPGNAGVEYLIGTVSVSFSGYVLPGSNTTASMGALPDYGSSLNKKYNFLQDGVATGNLQGNNALIATGASATSLVSPLGAMSFTFTTNVTSTGGTNAANISASLGITGPTTLLGGTSTSVTGSVTNSGSGSGTTNPLNWTQTGPGVVSLAPSSGSNLAGGATTGIAGSVGATPNGFGPWNVNVTFTGTDASTGVTVASSPVVKGLAFTIIGSGTKGTTDGNGVPGGTYGNNMSTQVAVTTLAGLTTTLGSGAATFGIGKTSATILAGTLGSASLVTETWRSRSSNETPAGSLAAGGAPLFLPLYSDVVNLSFSGSSPANVANAYALQVTYDPNELGGVAAAQNAASNGFLFLGYRSSDGRWYNATNSTRPDGNTAPGPNAVTNFQGSYAAFTTANNFSLANLMGSWGVDTAANTVWGVLDHDAEFAAVPEPGTIALLVGGIAAVGFAYRRRKVAKA